MLTQAPATLYQGGVIRPVYLHGSAVSTTWRDASRSLTDLIFGCVQAALGRFPQQQTDDCFTTLTSMGSTQRNAVLQLAQTNASARYSLH